MAAKKIFNVKRNNRFLAAFILTALCAVSEVFAQNAPTDAAGYLKRGQSFMEQKDWDNAIADFTQVIKLASNNTAAALAYFSRGTAYAQKDDYTQARVDLEKAMQLDPNGQVGQNARKAIEMLERAGVGSSSGAPTDAAGYLRRGAAFAQQKDWDNAIADCTQAIKLDPNNANAYTVRGIAYFNKGDYALARADFEKAAQLDPSGQAGQTARAGLEGLKGKGSGSSSGAPSSGGGSSSGGSGSSSSSSSSASSSAGDSKPKQSVVSFAGSYGLYLNALNPASFSFGLPLQLGVNFNFADMRLALLGEAGAGMGIKRGLLFEWNYGGAAEFYFPGKRIGLGFAYGLVDSVAVTTTTGDLSTNAFDRMSYMRFSLIFTGTFRTALYGALYGDRSWGLGLQWGAFWL